MISKTTIMLGAATCLSVTAGLFAPDVICGMQSRMDADVADSFQATQISFEPSSHSSVLEALRLYESPDAVYKMDDGANLTADDVTAAAREAISQFAAAGFGDPGENNVVDVYAVPFLYVNQGRSASGIIWGCELLFSDKESTSYLYVDDATGKVICCVSTIYHPIDGLDATQVSRPTLKDMQRWTDACQAYWGLGLRLDSVDEESIDGVSASVSIGEAYGVDDASEKEDGASMAEANSALEFGYVEDASEKAEQKSAALAAPSTTPSLAKSLDAQLDEWSDDQTEDGLLFEKLLSEYLSSGDIADLMAVYDGFGVSANVSVEDDSSLTMQLSWRFGVNYDALYEFWAMMPL